jgi:hypothetical protein
MICGECGSYGECIYECLNTSELVARREAKEKATEEAERKRIAAEKARRWDSSDEEEEEAVKEEVKEETETHFCGSRSYKTSKVVLSFCGGAMPMVFQKLREFVEDELNDCSMACVFGGEKYEQGEHSKKARFVNTTKKIGLELVDPSQCSICSKWNKWMDTQPNNEKLVRWTQCKWTDVWKENMDRVIRVAHSLQKKEYFIVEGQNRGAGMAFERNYIRNCVRQNRLPAPTVIHGIQIQDTFKLDYRDDHDQEIGNLDEDKQLEFRANANETLSFHKKKPKKKKVDKLAEREKMTKWKAKLTDLCKDIDEESLSIPVNEYAFLRDFREASNWKGDPEEGDPGWTMRDGWDTLEDYDQSKLSLYGVTITNGCITEINMKLNNMRGIIPETIGRCEQLKKIILPQNLLSGQIPVSIGNLKALTEIDLSSNHFTGGIPKQMSDCVGLEQLILSYNELGGEDEDGEICGINAQGLTYCFNLASVGLAKNNFDVEDMMQTKEILVDYFGHRLYLTLDLDE